MREPEQQDEPALRLRLGQIYFERRCGKSVGFVKQFDHVRNARVDLSPLNAGAEL